MSLRALRWLALMAAGAWAGLTGCASPPSADHNVPERFADAYVELVPVAALMGQSAAQDPRWPLGAKAALVSEPQLSCMRQALSSAEIETAQRKLALKYAAENPATLADDLAVLEGGAARLIGQAMRAGGGLPSDHHERRPTAEQSRALVAFATEARYANLRQATGLARLAGGTPDQAQTRGQDISRTLTVNFMTDAFLRCHIPVKLLY